MIHRTRPRTLLFLWAAFITIPNHKLYAQVTAISSQLNGRDENKMQGIANTSYSIMHELSFIRNGFNFYRSYVHSEQITRPINIA